MDDGLKTLYAFYERIPRSDYYLAEEQRSLAKEQGYLFDYPKYETHEEALKRNHQLVEQTDPRDVANAFLFSLSTRKLEYRSALGSYYYAKAVSNHDLMNGNNETGTGANASCHCYYCGWSAWKKAPGKYEQGTALNEFNYQRYKYGGIQHTRLNYALFDLEQFAKLPKVVSTEEDRQIFGRILAGVGQLNHSDKVGKLRDWIIKAKLFRTNQSEVSVLLNILGICGILAGPKYPAYEEYFANEYERAPVEHNNDFAYPVNRWRAMDGVNAQRVEEIFGEGFGL